MDTRESAIHIVGAFGAGKYRCPQGHTTAGVLRITVNDTNYDGCATCFGTWLQSTYPSSAL